MGTLLACLAKLGSSSTADRALQVRRRLVGGLGRHDQLVLLV